MYGDDWGMVYNPPPPNHGSLSGGSLDEVRQFQPEGLMFLFMTF